MKKLLLILLCLPIIGFSQSKYGADEQKCKENLAMFREYYKQKNYDDAYNPWRWVYVNCPESSGNIFKNAPKILKAKMKADKANKSAYVDTLMMVFDDRVKYFGKEGYVLGIKGYELFWVDNSRSEEALGYLKRSIELEGRNASVQAVFSYMKAIVLLERRGKKTIADVLNTYIILEDIFEYNIENESQSFIKFGERFEVIIQPYKRYMHLTETELEAEELRLVRDDVEIEDEIEIEDTESDEDIEIEIEEEDDEEVFITVENMPIFPCLDFSFINTEGLRYTKNYCGDEALMKFVQKNVKYPSIAKEYNITGKVYASFIVGKDGSVTNVKIVRGVDKNLDAEVIRLVKSFPKYKPGIQRGKPVRVMFTIPINFTLN
jgi:TonB family protein